MYHIGVKTRFFLRKIAVVQHNFTDQLSYATRDGTVTILPSSAIKKFVVYADYWDHAYANREEPPKPDQTALVGQLEQENEELQKSLKKLSEELQLSRQQRPANPPALGPEELMAREAVRRATERMNAFQPTS